MILKNNTTKGKFYTIVVEGVPQRVWIGAFQEYDLTKISKQFDGEVVNYGRRVTSLAANRSNNSVLVKGNSYLLIGNLKKQKNFYNVILDNIIYHNVGDQITFEDGFYMVASYEFGLSGIEAYLYSSYGDVSENINKAGTFELYANNVLIASLVNEVGGGTISVSAYYDGNDNFVQVSMMTDAVSELGLNLKFKFTEAERIIPPIGSYVFDEFRRAVAGRFGRPDTPNKIYLDASYGDVSGALSNPSISGFKLVGIYEEQGEVLIGLPDSILAETDEMTRITRTVLSYTTFEGSVPLWGSYLVPIYGE